MSKKATTSIYLLEPIINTEKYSKILIWSDNESNARMHAHPPCLARKKGAAQDMITIENTTFYENNKNARCKELDKTEYKIVTKNDSTIHIIYNNNHYILTINEAEIID